MYRQFLSDSSVAIAMAYQLDDQDSVFCKEPG
jgi:hypothetical protein